MKHLISHLLSNHLDSIVSQSILHCHVRGLHSIMLLQSPERTIRLYITDTSHQLYHNYPAEYGSTQLSLGFHAHHCQLTLEVVRGTMLNWTVGPARSGFLADRYLWRSPITTEETGGFILDLRGDMMETLDLRILSEGKAIHMAASAIHTVAVKPGEIAAWLVYEGREDPGYVPYTWSNADLTAFDTTGLYAKPTEEEVLRLITLAWVI